METENLFVKQFSIYHVVVWNLKYAALFMPRIYEKKLKFIFRGDFKLLITVLYIQLDATFAKLYKFKFFVFWP